MLFNLEIVLQILLSLLIGGLIGFQREITRHPAGFRTHMLVCVGATIVMLTGLEIYYTVQNAHISADPTRLAAQVISGIGFLGAGTIIRDGVTVKGLTTAASLWVVACIGLAIGAKAYLIALAGSFFIYFILAIFDKFEKRIIFGRNAKLLVSIECTEVGILISKLNEIFADYNTTYENISISNNKINLNQTITLIVIATKLDKKDKFFNLSAKISQLEHVVSVNINEI